MFICKLLKILKIGSDKINLFEKLTKLLSKILVPKSCKYILSFLKQVLKILSLETKPNLFNTHGPIKR